MLIWKKEFVQRNPLFFKEDGYSNHKNCPFFNVEKTLSGKKLADAMKLIQKNRMDSGIVALSQKEMVKSSGFSGNDNKSFKMSKASKERCKQSIPKIREAKKKEVITFDNDFIDEIRGSNHIILLGKRD